MRDIHLTPRLFRETKVHFHHKPPRNDLEQGNPAGAAAGALMQASAGGKSRKPTVVAFPHQPTSQP
jgi:hypothetical protein